MRYLLGVALSVAVLDAHHWLKPVAMVACSAYTILLVAGARRRQ